MHPATLPTLPLSDSLDQAPPPPAATPVPLSFEVLVEQLLANRDNSLKPIVAILERDVGLKGEVIRLANSLVYSSGRPVSSLAQAVACLGYRRCRDLITARLAKATGIEPAAQRTDPPQSTRDRGGTLLRGRRRYRKERLSSLYPPKNRRHLPQFVSSVFD